MKKRSVTTQLLRTFFITLMTSLVALLAHMLVNEKGGAFGLGDKGDSGKHRATALACIESPGDEGLESIGGLESVKRDLETLISAMRAPKVFFDPDEPSITPPSRLLFAGPPGTGKTMLAKALAVDVGATFMTVTLSTLEDKYFGETPKILRSIFNVAREKAKEQPVVLFFDEIDGIMRKRRDDDQSHVYGLKTEFLQHLDTLRGAVVVVGCTNCADQLDAALKRRLPDVYKFPLPGEAERLDILKRLTKNERRQRAATLEAVAKTCGGCSGSDLKQRYRRACLSRSRRVMRSVRIDATTTAADIARRMPALSAKDWGVA